jgi:hypothetical protein
MPHIEIGFDNHGNVIVLVRRQESKPSRQPISASIRRQANKIERLMFRRQLRGEHLRHGAAYVVDLGI